MTRRIAQPQCRKILVTGTHSTGKTGLLADLAALPLFACTAVVSEQARACPFTLNKAQNRLSTAWLLAAQIKAEIEVHTDVGTDLVLCDRGMPDILAYHQAATLAPPDGWMLEQARYWMGTYDLVLLARPDPARGMQADGLRLHDVDFRSRIQDLIEDHLSSCGIVPLVLPHTAKERLLRVASALTATAAP